MITNDGTKTYALKLPVTVGDKTYSAITLHPARACDLRDLAALRRTVGETDPDGFTLAIHTISILGRVPVQAVEQIDGADFNVLADESAFFIQGSAPSLATTPTDGVASSLTAPTS
jgi:hypothetical protein